ncbi:MAG: hypothetical protein N2558_03525 [Patescibacteria group bacterium]|nr:hypothetical protein [Patescibacteria group bacterium]
MKDDIDYPFGRLPPDNVSETEYRQSIENLREFAKMDLSEIQTLEDLSAHASLVGSDIKKVILTAGKIQTTDFTYKKPDIVLEEDVQVKARDQVWVIREKLSDGTYIFATSSRELTYITRYTFNENNQQISLYTVNLPADRDICSSRNEIINMSTNAVDWRWGQPKSFYPVNNPNDPMHQQEFARVLQDAIKDLLSVIPDDQSSDSDVPEPFRKIRF